MQATKTHPAQILCTARRAWQASPTSPTRVRTARTSTTACQTCSLTSTCSMHSTARHSICIGTTSKNTYNRLSASCAASHTLFCSLRMCTCVRGTSRIRLRQRAAWWKMHVLSSLRTSFILCGKNRNMQTRNMQTLQIHKKSR